MTLTKTQQNKLDAFIKKSSPCEKPCDRWGTCDNCCDAHLLSVGFELAITHADSLVGAVEHAIAIGYFNEGGSTAMMIKDALKEFKGE